MSQMWRADAGKAIVMLPLAVALTATARCVDRRADPARPARRRRRRAVAGVLLAFAPTSAVLLEATHGRSVRLEPPKSATGKTLLAAHVFATVGLEELIWRYPLTWSLGPRLRLLLTVLSAGGFAAAHLHRDGLARAQPHLLNTAGWTAAAIASRSVSWSTAAHFGYNWLVLTTRMAPTGLPS